MSAPFTQAQLDQLLENGRRQAAVNGTAMRSTSGALLTTLRKLG
jgi:hypothetical protein